MISPLAQSGDFREAAWKPRRANGDTNGACAGRRVLFGLYAVWSKAVDYAGFAFLVCLLFLLFLLEASNTVSNTLNILTLVTTRSMVGVGIVQLSHNGMCVTPAEAILPQFTSSDFSLCPVPDVFPHKKRANCHETANSHIIQHDPADERCGECEVQRVNNEASQRWRLLDLVLGRGSGCPAGKQACPLNDGADDGGADGVEPKLVGLDENVGIP